VFGIFEQIAEAELIGLGAAAGEEKLDAPVVRLDRGDLVEELIEPLGLQPFK
jgi:hypothetical protein